MSKHLYHYLWNLSDGYKDLRRGNVFGTFICGGGSSMGYKLAGFNHLGGVEIDKQIAEIYMKNHDPKYLYVEDIRAFNKRTDLPDELYNLDILDGSPPCSTFSMSGSREKAWGKEKKFKEGQAVQTLDDLVFVYIETINKLRPKVCLLENVTGIIKGNAKWYSKEIVRKLVEYGYNVQVFKLDASTMGVPQRRERVFFIGHNKNVKYPRLKLEFTESHIVFREIESSEKGKALNSTVAALWEKCSNGNSLSTVHPKGNYFGSIKLSPSKVPNTLIASTGSHMLHYKYPNNISKQEICRIGTFPMDYQYGSVEPKYLVGMSVPPVMIAQIANQIYIQWLSTEKQRVKQ